MTEVDRCQVAGVSGWRIHGRERFAIRKRGIVDRFMPSVANLMRNLAAVKVDAQTAAYGNKGIPVVKMVYVKMLTDASAVGGEPVKKIIVEVPTKHGEVQRWVTQANAVIQLILLRLCALEIAIAQILAAT